MNEEKSQPLQRDKESLCEVDGTANQQSNNHLIHRLMPPDSEPQLSCTVTLLTLRRSEIHRPLVKKISVGKLLVEQYMDNCVFVH